MQRDTRRRTLLDPPTNEAYSRADPIQQGSTQPEFCLVVPKPLCAVCTGNSSIKLTLEGDGSTEKVDFCSRRCIGKYFFKYQVPTTY